MSHATDTEKGVDKKDQTCPKMCADNISRVGRSPPKRATVGSKAAKKLTGEKVHCTKFEAIQ